ncbi:helix-hairpin-helix domain-containing protein [Streptomyces sp. NPDC059165]|uniref:helix-hairpin-helix domain-containing protein n=1 Tax=Streptomyces sp. NPDC059165 TaxID=3346751 RepID=UPI0036A9A67D
MTALPGATPGSAAAEDPEDPAVDASVSDQEMAGEEPAEAEGGPQPGPGDGPEGERDDEGDAEDQAAAGTSDTVGADAGPAPTDRGEAAAGDAGDAGDQLSEAQAELAAQRELRARIERRKAEKDGPVRSGEKLSGTAADLLAAVRAVEGGDKPSSAFFGSPSAPRRPVEPAAAAPVRAAVSPPEHGPRPVDPATVAAVLDVLVAGGAPESLAGRVAAVLGEQAARALREDPWRLLAVPGVQPEQADGFARALLGPDCRPDDGRRAAALVTWLLERAAFQGHTALESSAVRTALAGRSVPDPDDALEQAVAGGAVLLFGDGAESGGEPGDDGEPEGHGTDAAAEDAAHDEPLPVLVTLDRYALAEESLADGLARLVRTARETSWDDAAEQVGSPSAAELIRVTAAHGLVLHTGGEAARAEPLALVGAARGIGLRAWTAVHSENGRRRAGADAVTVEGLLSGAQGPGRDGDGMLALDLLAVLDAPQLDVETGAMLLESLPDGCRLVLSGDPGVLWSAGAGRVFADVAAARVCPRVTSRTPDPGPLGELVSGVGAGELLPVDAPDKEVVIVPVRDAAEAVHRTVQLVADSIPRAIGVPAEETQVITLGHGGSAGTRALNASLKQRLNPGPGRFGGFDPADRIAYAPGLGRTLPGTVVSADADGLKLDCEGTVVVVPKEQVATSVRHGWALTAHQAAGMRWPAAVVVLPGDAAQGLSRPWVYTAFSRGERHLSVVHGVDDALPRAVAQVPAPERTTRLCALLQGLLAPTD